MGSSLPGPSVHGILQARLLEWVAISFPRVSSWPRDQICISCTAGRFFTNEPLGKSIDPSICAWLGAYFHQPLVKYYKSLNQVLPLIHCGSAHVTSCSQPQIPYQDDDRLRPGHFLPIPRGEHQPCARHWTKGLICIMSFKPFYRWGNWGQESVNGTYSFLETHPWSNCKVWPSSPCDTYSTGTMADIIRCPVLFSYFFTSLTVILWNIPVLLFPEEEADTQRGQVTWPRLPSWEGMEKEFILSSPHTGFIIEWSIVSQVSLFTAWKLQENMVGVSLEIGASWQKQYFSLLTNTSIPPHAQPSSGLMDST